MFKEFRRPLLQVMTTYKRQMAPKTMESQEMVNLVNKSMVCPRECSTEEIKSILWTAMDLKQNSDRERLFEKRLSILQNKVINIIIERPTANNLIAALRGARYLSASSNVVFNSNLCDICGCFRDLGKMLSVQGDLGIISPYMHRTVRQITETATVPIINMGSFYQKPIESFTLLMTLWEKFDYLTGLTVVLIGSPTAVLHSFMCSLPRFGINLRLACAMSQDEPVSPFFLAESREKFSKYDSKIVNCATAEEALEEYDVVITLGSKREKFHTDFFTVSVVDNGEKDDEDQENGKNRPQFLHTLTRVDKKLNNNARLRSITFEFIDNLQWIYAALMLRLTENDYEHTIPVPKLTKD